MALSRHHAAAGVLGAEAWPSLPEAGKGARACRDRRDHRGGAARPRSARLPGSSRTGTRSCRADRGCRARHERLGLPQKFLDGLDELLRDAAALIPLDAPPVILTGEYIPENFLLSRDGGGWRLAGLIDFGDVMTGWGEYDLLGPSAFMTAGMPRRVQSLFEGFGYSDADIDPALKRRLMALMLLHRASDPVQAHLHRGLASSRPVICSNCRNCSGRFECRTAKGAQNICVFIRQICLFVCNRSGCRTPPGASVDRLSS